MDLLLRRRADHEEAHVSYGYWAITSDAPAVTYGVWDVTKNFMVCLDVTFDECYCACKHRYIQVLAQKSE